MSQLLKSAVLKVGALQRELEQQKRYVEINANSAHGKHMEGLRYRDERDALQVLLTAADERVDVLEGLLRGLMGHAEIYSSCWEFDEDADGVELANRIVAALKPAEGAPSPACTWSEGGFSWHTSCGKEWQFTDGGLPAENGMHFCHSCGKTLVVESVGGGDEFMPLAEVAQFNDDHDGRPERDD